jgi:hypothetical protein
MTAQSQLEAYLGDFRRRLRALIVARVRPCSRSRRS